MEVRKLQQHELEVHREIRLRSLSEAADVLGVTFADAFAKPTEYWLQRTQEVTREQLGALLLACEQSQPIGLIYGHVDTWLSTSGYASGFWIEPIYRGRGVGHRLLQALLEWGRERSLSEMLLRVHEHSRRAIELYLRTGFEFTGRRVPFPLDKSENMLEMRIAM